MRLLCPPLTVLALVVAGCSTVSSPSMPVDHPANPDAIGPMKVQSANTGAGVLPATMAMTEYTCPMHPEVVSDRPGSCPKCGMTLVKKEGPE